MSTRHMWEAKRADTGEAVLWEWIGQRSLPACSSRAPVIDGVPNPVPLILYTAAERGRGYRSACWRISRKGYETDPKAHWRDYGNKTLNVYEGAGKESQRLAAIKWASNRYGVTEWSRTPFGAYAPSAFVKARLAQLKEFAKANPA